jgi:lysine-N-methylase
MKPHMGKLIVLNADHSTASDYGRIPPMRTGDCPFLDGQHLCGIQSQLGPEMLSVTCSTYPRAVSTYAGEVEEALNLSCPEAARLTLLDAELPGRPGLDSGAGISWTATGAGRYAAFWHGAPRLEGQYQPGLAIRELVLLELTDRRYAVWQRLYLAGILARRLDALRGDRLAADWSAANSGSVAKLLSDSARVSVLERLRPAMDGIEAQPDMQLQLLMELLRIRCQYPPVAARFLECVQDFEKGLGCATANSEREILDAYAEGYSRWYLPLMERHPQVFENYLLNYVFKNHYPFGRPRHVALTQAEMLDAEGEHLLMCVHAALAQMLLIGMARRYGEEFGLEHVVKLIESLARTIEHSPQFLKDVTEFVRTHHLKNLRGIALLLRVV